jgi:hypothetical protein
MYYNPSKNLLTSTPYEVLVHEEYEPLPKSLQEVLQIEVPAGWFSVEIRNLPDEITSNLSMKVRIQLDSNVKYDNLSNSYYISQILVEYSPQELERLANIARLESQLAEISAQLEIAKDYQIYSS